MWNYSLWWWYCTLHSTIQHAYLNQETPTKWNTLSWNVYRRRETLGTQTTGKASAWRTPLCSLLIRILNAWLLRILSIHGIGMHIGSQPGVASQDGLYTLRTTRTTQRCHNQEMCLLFVDLVKAFDDSIWQSSWANDRLTQMIWHTRHVSGCHWKIIPGHVSQTPCWKGNFPHTIHSWSTKMRQLGSHSLPLCHAGTNIRDNGNERNEHLLRFEYCCLPTADRKTTCGRLTQRITTKGTLFYQLYIDDGVLLFETKNDLEKTRSSMQSLGGCRLRCRFQYVTFSHI